MDTHKAKTQSVIEERDQGPSAYENWRAKMENAVSHGSHEFPLYTDAYVTGGIEEGYGPYQLLLTHHYLTQSDALCPAIILRAEQYLDIESVLKEPMNKSDYERYHGGWIKDEIAALAVCRRENSYST